MQDTNLFFHESVFFESTTDEKIKDYEEQVKILQGMKRDGTPEKIYHALSVYFRIIEYVNLATAIICPIGLLAGLIDKLLADWLQDKSKRGKISKLQDQIDKDIAKLKKEVRKQNDPANIKRLNKNIETLEKLSNKL